MMLRIRVGRCPLELPCKEMPFLDQAIRVLPRFMDNREKNALNSIQATLVAGKFIGLNSKPL